jgi:transketolase
MERTGADPGGPAIEAAASALADAGATGRDLRVIDLEDEPSRFTRPFRERCPDRYEHVRAPAAEAMRKAADLARAGGPVVVSGPSDRVAVDAYPVFRREAARPRLRVTLVSTDGGWVRSDPAVLEDAALLRGVPGLALVVPADARTAAAALGAILRLDGAAYLRLGPTLPTQLGEVPFEIGRARQLRDGTDLALLAVGRPVELALDAAEALGRVGLSARVLDFASLAPIDEKAVLRAARDTGAVLTLEEHQALTGLGVTVAALTAEHAPVPVRRIGAPDLFGRGGDADQGPADLGIGLEAALEEAWELLRLKGKVQ